MQELSAEEAAARRNKLAKMRALLFYHEQKAKHLKAIKSKEYRRKLNKAARRKAKDGAAADGDSSALKAAAEDAEFERAKVCFFPSHHRSVKHGSSGSGSNGSSCSFEHCFMQPLMKRSSCLPKVT